MRVNAFTLSTARDDAGRNFAAVFQPDQHSPQWIAAHEVARAVDRIDDPAAAAAGVLARAFFPEQSVLWKIFLERGGDQPLALPVGYGHRRIVRLGFGGDSAALML
jgi:hypothetical protein